MTTRIVCMVLIAAVAACPMCRGVGFSMGAAGSDSARESVNGASGAACCCCSDQLSGTELPGQATSGQETPAPNKAPRGSSCQGICGGAVLEKPCELEDFEPNVGTPLYAVPASTSLLMAHAASHVCQRLDGISRPHHGRFVRIQISSFQC